MESGSDLDNDRGALVGRLFGEFGFIRSCEAIQFAQDAGVNFGDWDIDGDGLLADLDFLLIAAMAKFAFNFHVSAFGQLGGYVRHFVPQHDTVPFGPAVIAAVLLLPAALGSEREIRDGRALEV